MLKIRFQRFGKKHQPIYRVVVTDRRNGPKSGAFLEVLGWYNPREKSAGLKKERIQERLRAGAQASDTVYNLLVREGIIRGEKRDVSARKKSKKAPSGTDETEIRKNELDAEGEETEKAEQADAKTEGDKEGAEEEGASQEAKKTEEEAPPAGEEGGEHGEKREEKKET